MKKYFPCAKWLRAANQLPLKFYRKVPSYTNYIKEYLLFLDPPNPYPRLHLRAMFSKRPSTKYPPSVKLDMHVDQKKHESHNWSDKIQKIVNLIDNS